MPQTPTRFLSGVATQKPNTLFGNYPFPCPPEAYSYYNDFPSYVAGDWTVAPATGSSALAASNGGVLRLTTGAANGNGQGNALNPASFLLTPGYQMWFAINVLFAANSSLANFVFGLTAGGASAPTSGIYFSKPTSSSTVSMIINKAASTTTMTNTTTIADTVASTYGFFYDGKPTPTLYSFSSTAFPTTYYNAAFGVPQIFGGFMFGAMGGDQTVASPLQPLTNLPAVVLQPSFFLQANGGSGAITMDVDYVFGSTEIPRF